LMWLDKGCALKDPYALYEKVTIKQNGLYGTPRDKYAPFRMLEEEATGSVFKLSNATLDRSIFGTNKQYKNLALHPGKLKEFIENEVKKNNITFKNIKFLCYLRGEWEYPWDHDAARRFLMQTPGDNKPEPLNREYLYIDEIRDIGIVREKEDCILF
jgi:hypothetical protein